MANPDLAPGALAKDPKGTAVLERRARRAARDTFEKTEKAKVVARDGAHYCRLVPGCGEKEKHETAHIVSKSLGGSSEAQNMVRACLFHHRGNWSLHSGDLMVEFLTPDGANGSIAVWAKHDRRGKYMVGREVGVGIWERD